MAARDDARESAPPGGLSGLDALIAGAEADLAAADGPEAVERVKVALLGRKGALQAAFGTLGTLPPEERKAAGARLNAAKVRLEERVAARLAALGGGRAAGPDLTFPGRRPVFGSAHPLTVVTEEILRILRGLGFERAEGPEVDTETYNFTLLNTPADHPARDMQDTYYLELPPAGADAAWLLRSQTSSVWGHVMERRGPPLRIACPGRCFRRDAADSSHSPSFHQIEGLWIDERCRFSDLKGVLTSFLQAFFGADTAVIFEPRYFPFTEPSAEVSIACTVCRGAGCRTCGRAGKLELLGAGMVHPAVLERLAARNPAWGDPALRGFAFGVGVERLAIMKFRIPDMRLLFDNDLRVTSQIAG